jgi:hypothetical protein
MVPTSESFLLTLNPIKQESGSVFLLPCRIRAEPRARLGNFIYNVDSGSNARQILGQFRRCSNDGPKAFVGHDCRVHCTLSVRQDG